MQFRKLPIAMMAMALMMAGSAQASLIGDSVTLSVTYGLGPTTDDDTVVVAHPSVEFSLGNGTEIGTDFLLSALETIDLQSTAIRLSLVVGLQGTFTLSGIDGVVTGISGAPAGGVTLDQFSVAGDGHSFSFRYIGGDAPSSTAPLVSTLNITFEDTNGGGGTPEPATMALMGAGLVGLFWMKRR